MTFATTITRWADILKEYPKFMALVYGNLYINQSLFGCSLSTDVLLEIDYFLEIALYFGHQIFVSWQIT